MSIKSGTYEIVNVRQSNLATLADGNDDTPLTANFKQNVDKEKWKVSLRGGRYSIQNVGFGTFASVSNRAKAGTGIEGKDDTHDWKIEETRVKGQFTIGATESDLIWSLADNQADTPVTLASSNTDTRNWWMFKSVF